MSQLAQKEIDKVVNKYTKEAIEIADKWVTNGFEGVEVSIAIKVDTIFDESTAYSSTVLIPDITVKVGKRVWM